MSYQVHQVHQPGLWNWKHCNHLQTGQHSLSIIRCFLTKGAPRTVASINEHWKHWKHWAFRGQHSWIFGYPNCLRVHQHPKVFLNTTTPWLFSGPGEQVPAPGCTRAHVDDHDLLRICGKLSQVRLTSRARSKASNCSFRGLNFAGFCFPIAWRHSNYGQCCQPTELNVAYIPIVIVVHFFNYLVISS